MLAFHQYPFFARSPHFGWRIHSTAPFNGSKTLLSSSDEGFHWTVDVPGVDAAHLNLEVEGREVRLKTERKYGDESEFNAHRWRLPQSANPETLAAELSNGVLKISFDKYPSDQSRTVEISVSKAA